MHSSDSLCCSIEVKKLLMSHVISYCYMSVYEQLCPGAPLQWFSVFSLYIFHMFHFLISTLPPVGFTWSWKLKPILLCPQAVTTSFFCPAKWLGYEGIVVLIPTGKSWRSFRLDYVWVCFYCCSERQISFRCNERSNKVLQPDII